MEYKKCEHCGEEIHIRSKKCPFCNKTVKEVIPKEVEQDKASEEKIEKEINEINENKDVVANTTDEEVTHENNNVVMPNYINFEVGADGKPKDYVYKAEVRHSLQYTDNLSNVAKVFISALCTLPIIGQMIGGFLGVFFSTYEDSDRRSFGKALIFLSIFMFVLYLAYIKYAAVLLQGLDINELYNSLGQ